MIRAGSKIRLMLAFLAAWLFANFGGQLQAGLIMVSDGGQVETPNATQDADQSAVVLLAMGWLGETGGEPAGHPQEDNDGNPPPMWSASLRLQKLFVLCRVEASRSSGFGAQVPAGSGLLSGNLSAWDLTNGKSRLVQLAGYLASLQSGAFSPPPCPMGIFRPPRSAVFAQLNVLAA